MVSVEGLGIANLPAENRESAHHTIYGYMLAVTLGPYHTIPVAIARRHSIKNPIHPNSN